MKKLLKINNPPTAVLACSDYMAIGAMNAIFEENWEVPEDIAVIGFDDLYIDRKNRTASCLSKTRNRRNGQRGGKTFLTYP